MVYSKKRFILCLTLCRFVVFFSPFSIAITSLGEERANLSAFQMLVWFVLVLDLSVSSSSRYLGRAAVYDCGTPWTFLLTFFSTSIFQHQRKRQTNTIKQPQKEQVASRISQYFPSLFCLEVFSAVGNLNRFLLLPNLHPRFKFCKNTKWLFSSHRCSLNQWNIAQKKRVNELNHCDEARMRARGNHLVCLCLCWGFTAQSTQMGHVERGQFT